MVQLLGREYAEAVCQGAILLQGAAREELEKIVNEEIDFIPEEFISKMDSLLYKVGQQVISPMQTPDAGAPTDSYRKASALNASPVGGLGYLRLGEDGRLYLVSKSEHYHTPLGHSFPGYRLIDKARALGIGNATHNNTRGYITRLMEKELVRTANGLQKDDKAGLEAILSSREPQVLNRVINLETGSLACEAGIKMMLSRFYRLDATFPKPKYEGRTPVFFVVSDNEGGTKANYHGTTVFAQMMRDLWPEIACKLEDSGALKVCPVKINDFEDFRAKLEQYNKPPFKAAGFLHEIILMNYGGIRLKPDYLRKVYELCHSNDTPVLCDEIQSCMWYPGMYLFRLYGLKPDFVVIGKGFPGGQYAASRIITTAEMDSLNQFGALVTNGQEELASLAYLITMAFAEENADYVEQIGSYYESRVRELMREYPDQLQQVEGQGHLLTLFFHSAEQVVRFTKLLNEQCIDISAQTYKAMCPPAALTKIPVIATHKMVDYFIAKMAGALR